MTIGHSPERWQTDGKFFRAGATRVPVLCVTYGPFPEHRTACFNTDFERIAAAGFNSIRLYEMPTRRLLDAALRHGLRVFGGLQWSHLSDFRKRPGLVTEAKVLLTETLRPVKDHPALACVYVGNEIPTDLVRWMDPVYVREVLEDLIATGKDIAPNILFAYANYPSTEYLEPANADFTAFNIYLEKEENLRNYLRRLHHIAGDRPLVISEFGMDSRRNGVDKQAETLGWAVRTAREEEAAGMTVYSWSDHWSTGGAEILDWDFGLIDREGRDKPALRKDVFSAFRVPPHPQPLPISVIVCTRNGRTRIGACLTAIRRMAGGGFETIVVDDGSTDGTADFVETSFPEVTLLRLEPSGLSAARNAGAAAATGRMLAFTDDDCEPDFEWLLRLRRAFENTDFAAAGGPNLPPPPRTWREAVVCAAPGAPSHVMLNDVEAEHLPGCNIAVTKAAFDAIGGFDPIFHTAGDDVDFCWRLREAGFRLGFAPGAFVWHWRRPLLRTFLRQQIGYGKAESLLMRKHPQRFSKAGGARWEGFVYGGGPVRALEGSVIYHGPMGTAGYQKIVNRMLPLRELNDRFDSLTSRLVLGAVRFLQPRLRAWARNRTLLLKLPVFPETPEEEPSAEFGIVPSSEQDREFFLKFLVDRRWKPAGDTDGWDVEKYGTRVLIASEYREGHKRSILFRVWGDASQLQRYMSVERKTR